MRVDSRSRNRDWFCCLSAILVTATGLAVNQGCGGSGDGPPVQHFASHYMTGLQGPVGSVVGLTDEGIPAPNGGPDATVDPLAVNTINGAGYPATLTSTTAFSQIWVAIENGPVQVNGAWHITLPAPVNTADIFILFPTDTPASRFDVVYGLTNSTGLFGQRARTEVRLITALAGDVQAAVIWDVESDVDLHLWEPDSTHIYFGNRSSASGATLDIDSNAGCSIDGIKVENISWPLSRTPPAGVHRAQVHLWSACSTPQSNVTLLLRVAGQNPSIQTTSAVLSAGTLWSTTLAAEYIP